jgi:CHAT domain-containing protein
LVEFEGALAAVPVQALTGPDGAYLGDRFAVTVAIGERNRAPAPTARAKRALVVANPLISGASAARFPPLQDSEREAEAVSAAFPAIVLKGPGASFQAFAAALPGADVVHIAGHGYSTSDDGALLLAAADPAAADYDLLRAESLAGLDWSRCSLAVLSACATAAGETRGERNPASLVRALARAGAARVAASLWNADSAATAALMDDFYRRLASGQPPAAALWLAQRHVRTVRAWSHPYYWAGFQLYERT